VPPRCGVLGTNCINCPTGCGKCVCDGICNHAEDDLHCPTDCP